MILVAINRSLYETMFGPESNYGRKFYAARSVRSRREVGRNRTRGENTSPTKKSALFLDRYSVAIVWVPGNWKKLLYYKTIQDLPPKSQRYTQSARTMATDAARQAFLLPLARALKIHLPLKLPISKVYSVVGGYSPSSWMQNTANNLAVDGGGGLGPSK